MRKFVACTFLGMFSAFLSAAESGQSMVKLGIQGGLSFANASTPADMSSTSQTGFLAGINLDIRLSRVFSLQPELMFAQRRANLLNSSGFKLTGKYNSIELPLLAKVSLGESVRPYVFAGPVAIFNVSNEFVAEGTGVTGGVSFEPRTVDFAAEFGVGLALGPVFGNLRYSLGLLDYDRSHANWKSNGIQLLIGVSI